MSNSIVPAALRQLPWSILILLVLLTGFGLVVLVSAADGSLTPWAANQGVRFLVFLAGALALARLHPSRWQMLAFPAWGLFVAVLLVTGAIGAIGGGAKRWLDLGIIRLQPSELMKPIIVLAMARYYELLPAGEIRRFLPLIPAGVLVGVPAGIVLLQPDLGTALMIAAGGITVMFLAGVPLRLFAGAFAAVAAAMPLALAAMHDYQRNRILIFLDPESDPLGTGYHISQSKIAIGAGGIFGKGFLGGTQNHLDYLPEGHTDFAFATMAEDFGMIGGLFIIGAFLMLVLWGLRIANRAETRFARFAAAGLSATLFFYFAINLMMVMGLAPVVGIPLPLISFGGTAMMTVLIIIGILMSLDRDRARR